jgi:hypothetical protein
VPLAALLVLLVLAGCNSGNAREAERGREAQASEEARLPELQATYSADFFEPGTPPPGSTPTPDASLPTLDRLVLTRNVGGNGPTEELASVPANLGTVYAGALLHGLRRGTVVSAIWRSERGNVFFSEATVDRDAADAWVGLSMPLDGSLAPGEYAVIVLVAVGEDPPVSLNSLVFEITPSGSQPQAVGSGRAPRIVPNDGDADEDVGRDDDFEEDDFEDEGFEDDGGFEGGSDSGEGSGPPIVPVEEDE